MNVMKAAHKYAKHLISKAPHLLTYRSALKASLIRAHKEYKAMTKAISTASRDLYRFVDLDTKAVVAFITGSNIQNAIDKYKLNGGIVVTTLAEKISHGYPEEMCTIYK